MKIATIVSPSSALFLPAVERLLRQGGHEVTRFDGDNILVPPHDAYWVEWAGYAAAFASNTDLRGAPLVVRLHRYEVNEPHFLQIRWENVTALVVTSEHVAARARAVVPDLDERTRVVVIPSIVDFERFTFLDRDREMPDRDARIGVVANVNGRKQPGLWLQILAKVQRGVTLHACGEEQDAGLLRYMRNLASRLGVADRFVWDGWVDPAAMNAWWADKDWCLSTSADEGCPYNVVEAMACGVQPVVHEYEGAAAQFPDALLWRTVDEACDLIHKFHVSSAMYREIALARYSIQANRAAVLALFGGAA